MKKILSISLTLLIMAATGIFAYTTLSTSAATYSYYTYEVENGQATLTNCQTYISGNVTIPSTLGGYPVTKIGKSAFDFCSSMKTVTIPSSVTYIGDEAFRSCTKLTSVNIPSAVTEIGSNAFLYCNVLEKINITDLKSWCEITFKNPQANPIYYCKNLYLNNVLLTELNIPEGTQKISKNAFYSHTGITSVTLPSTVKTIESSAFSKCTTLSQINFSEGLTNINSGAFTECTAFKEIVLPDSIEFISASAFRYCSNIERMTLPCVSVIENQVFGELFGPHPQSQDRYNTPSSLTEITLTKSVNIPANAFRYCTFVTRFNLPEGLKTIGELAFSCCYDLKEITIPESVTEIGTGAFAYSSLLNKVNTPNISAWCNIDFADSTSNPLSIAKKLYHNNELVTEVDISDNTTAIKKYALYNCESITSVDIPDNVTEIQEQAFYNCTGLTSVNLSKNIANIQAKAFYGCSGIKNIVLPETLINIYEYAFAENTSLETITFGNKLEKIAPYAFTNCISLTELNLPQSVKEIGYSAFKNCSSVVSANIPDNVSEISNEMFYGCEMLSNITLHNNITEIGDSAFEGCKTLLNITLPNNLKIIEYKAFYNCANLNSVIFSNSVTSLGISSFANCNKLSEIVLPDSITEIGKNCFSECTELKKVTIPNSVNTDIYSIFEGCNKLQSISVPNINGYLGSLFGATDYTYNGDYVPKNLKEVIITNADVIPDYAFYRCNNITNIIINGKTTSIGKSAFYNCALLESIKLPETLTSVDESAFYNCSVLDKVYISNISAWCNIDFANIDSNPLSNAKKLYLNNELVTNLIIPNDVTKIKAYTFYNCESIEKVTFPNSLTSIEQSAFYECYNLSEIIWSNSIESIDKFAFSYCGISLLILPEGVKYVGTEAFACCDKLTSAVLPDSLNSIGRGVFSHCDSLKTLSIPFIGDDRTHSTGYLSYIFGGENNIDNEWCLPESLETVKVTDALTIYKNSFYNCKYLKNIVISNTVTEIEKGALIGCVSLESLSLPFIGDKAENGNYSYLGYLFGASYYQDNPYSVPASLKEVNLTSSQSVPDYAFYGCNGIETVKLSDGITQIGNYTFYDCIKLADVNIPEGVTDIGKYAFYNCINISSVSIPKSLKSVGNLAFHPCTGIKKVYITDLTAWCNIDFASTYSNPLYYAENLYLNGKLITNLVIPSNITKIKDYTFINGKCFKSVTINKNITNIGYYSFYGCSSFTNVVIPDSVKELGKYSFMECSGLASITLPFAGQTKDSANCTHFGWIFGADSYSDTASHIPEKLKNVTLTNSLRIADNTFYGCSNIENINLNSGVIAIGSWAFYKCSNLKTVTIPKSVVDISDTAFSLCSSLNTINCTYGSKAYNFAKSKGFGYNVTCEHKYDKYTTVKATISKNGYVLKECSLCGKDHSKTSIIYRPVSFKLSATSYVYNGKVKTPTVTIKNSAGKILKKNTDYTITYAKGRKNVGKYKVTITFKGNYSGTKILYFTIKPVNTTLKSLTAGKKSLKVAITKKTTQVTGYQIQYATNKNFKSAKTKIVTSYKTTSVNLTKLTAKKTYYVRVRTYKTVNGVKYYSAWSTVKYKKTK